MFFKKLGVASIVLVGLAAVGTGTSFGQSTAVARRPAPGVPKSKAVWVPEGLSPEAVSIYKYVKKRVADEFKWQEIPWVVDLPEAIRQARIENRPVLLWVAGAKPLGRC
jgi:hypothetical protein